MKQNEFNEVVEAQLEKCKSLLTAKGREYAGPEDALHNFVVAAELQGVTPQQALAGMMGKHTVSVYDMIRSPQPFPAAKWDEKITDHINYLLILQAVVTEERNKRATTGTSAASTSTRTS